MTVGNRPVKRRRLRSMSAGLILAWGICLAPTPSVADDVPDRIYELRTYTATEGNLDKLKLRFRNHATLYLLKHGMQLVGYWTPMDEGESGNSLLLLLSHESRKAADEAWLSLAADPEWQRIREATNTNGPLVAGTKSMYMTATDFSPMK